MADMSLSFNQVFTKVQTALPKCIKTENAAPITDLFNSKIPEGTKHCIESAVRNYVTKNLIQGEKTKLSSITAVTLVCIELVRNELSLPTLPVQVLGDSFDTLTIDECEELFAFVESNVSIWKEDTFFSTCKTSVLRMCNDLLRRLSRSQNTVFCGRILLFLARFFPFSERSGLNLISEFNLENVTTFTNVEQDPEEMEEETKEKEGGGVSLDYTLYTKFWSLQDFFRNPPQCFQKAPWKMFTVYCGDVLEAFKSFKLDNVQSRSTTAAQLSRTLSTEPSQETTKIEPQDQYFAKYLTNQKLLDLQFSDANFRRYVLLQILILTQYLTSDIRFKSETLTEEQLSWVRKTEELVFSLLAETPPDGIAFVGTVKHILKRELMWSDWKNNGCPDIKGPTDDTDRSQNGKKEDWDSKSVTKKRGKKRLGDIVREADSKRKYSMGNAEMSRLWNLHQDNMEACKSNERDFVPAWEAYFNPAIEQLSGKVDMKDQEKLVNDSNFGWRALRLLANRSPHFFTHSASPIATLPEYLTTMIKKLAKELPSQLADDIKAEEEEDKEDEKVILEQNDGVKDEEESMEVDGGEEDRPEIRAINEDEQKALAKNLVKLGNEKWKVLAKKIGFQDDEIEYIETEKGKKGNFEGAASHMLHLWVENEGEEANRDNLLYTLGGLKMTEIADGVFT